MDKSHPENIRKVQNSEPVCNAADSALMSQTVQLATSINSTATTSTTTASSSFVANGNMQSAFINAANPFFGSVLTANELEQIQKAKKTWFLQQQQLQQQIIQKQKISLGNDASTSTCNSIDIGVSKSTFLQEPPSIIIPSFNTNCPVNNVISPALILPSNTKQRQQPQQPVVPLDSNVITGITSSVDSPLIKPNELKHLQSFFDSQLFELDQPADITLTDTNSSSCLLFNENEQEFLTNFLDTFLAENVNPSVLNNGLSGKYDENLVVPETIISDIQQQSFLSHSSHLPQNSTSNLSFSVGLSETSSSIIDTVEPISSNTTITAGTVPIPVIAPRKKRHKSKELLTEEEKRANHIASEQKRRRNIRAGFHALSMLIPELSKITAPLNNVSDDNNDAAAGDEEEPPFTASTPVSKRKRTKSEISSTSGMPSKSVILTKTIQYLHYLIKRNQKLHNRMLNLRSRLVETGGHDLDLSNK